VPEGIEEGISGVVVDSRDDALRAIEQTRTFNRPGVLGAWPKRWAQWPVLDSRYTDKPLISDAGKSGSPIGF
jgi:hypothetical protein